MTKKPGFKAVLSVLHADLIGKDSHRSITLTYGWMANQVGHFCLGFVPTFILYNCGISALKSVLIVGLFWLAFEIYNSLSPLYKKEYKGNKTFKVHWINLTFDTFTDLCFFWIGGLTLYFLVAETNKGIWFFLAALLVFTLAIRYWFMTKLYQQNASLPYPFRLSQWDKELDKEYVVRINRFLKLKNETGYHFLVLGSKGSGKTRLSVGIANEMAIRHKMCTYTTFSKWIGMLKEKDDELKKNNFSIWSWIDSELIVLDDINPGQPDLANKYTAEDTLTYIQNEHAKRNTEVLQKINVFWIVGKVNSNDSIDNWFQMLKQIGVDENKIVLFDLNTYGSNKLS